MHVTGNLPGPIFEMEEIVWKPIPGFAYYEASNFGSIRRIDRQQTLSDGRIRKLRGRVLRPMLYRGYKTVHPVDDQGKKQTRKVSVLVCAAFHGARPPRSVCRHLNDVRSDDRACNLAWGSVSENGHDAVRNGVARVAEAHPNAQLSNEDVIEIRKLGWSPRCGLTLKQIANEYGVSQCIVHKLLSGKTYRSVQETL